MHTQSVRLKNVRQVYILCSAVYVQTHDHDVKLNSLNRMVRTVCSKIRAALKHDRLYVRGECTREQIGQPMLVHWGIIRTLR